MSDRPRSDHAPNTSTGSIELDDIPWRPANLSDEVSIDIWRMWHHLALPTGDHAAEARATDTSGYTQTDQLAQPLSNVATGWPSVGLAVS